MSQSRRRRPVPDDPAVPADGAERAGPATSRRRMATMRDIATAASVSQSTVSRVLSGVETRVPIAPETRERVIAVSRRLGYRPNPLARGLRGASTNLIGAVVRDFSDPFFAEAVEVLVRESMAHGYNVVLGHVHPDLDDAIPLTSVLETRHTDAIVLLGDVRVHPHLLDDLHKSRVPVVGLWQGTSALQFPTVDTDDRAGIRAGLDHLASLGHRRIAFVSAELPGDFWIRESTYGEFMRERLDGVPEGYIQRSPNSMAGGDAAIRRLLTLPAPPTAVATSTDMIAVGVLHGAHSLGATVPSRLSVVGFDGILVSGHTVPALTTSRMPIAQIVGHGINLAVAMARDPEAVREPSLEIFPPELVIRDSTAPPAHRRARQ